jgi:outer membrane protein OmpA-like peptidoglycan-associated protein
MSIVERSCLILENHLSKQTYPTLSSITEILKEYPYSRFLIEGHTDSDGSNEMNQTLSKTELQRLKLFENGIKADRLNSWFW